MATDFDAMVDALQEQILEETRKEYSAVVVDHWMHPRNPGPMDDPSGHGRVTGPCGDTMEIFIRVANDLLTEVRFTTDGCGTSIASASMAVHLATGKALAEASAISQVTILDALDGLPPDSEHCGLLAADTLRAAIDDYLSTTAP